MELLRKLKHGKIHLNNTGGVRMKIKILLYAILFYLIAINGDSSFSRFLGGLSYLLIYVSIIWDFMGFLEQRSKRQKTAN